MTRWQGDGVAIFHKRLEEGTFELPPFLHDQTHVVINVLILQGISLEKVQYRKRYNQKMPAR